VHVLLVEDDAALGALVARGLAANGYAVAWARDGDEGYDRACGGAFDVLVVDVMLPGLDGLALVRALRADGLRAPVLLLTARGSVADRVAGLDAGADDYLVKPFAFEELLARLRALLRRPPGPLRPAALSCGNLSLVPGDRLVTVGGNPVDVPPREFDVLEYLLRNAGQTVSRGQILERVWGDPDARRANVAEATISRLRRRLGDAGWNGAVVAVTGLGYRLLPPA
jgi:two-component system OmpR family response regulator